MSARFFARAMTALISLALANSALAGGIGAFWHDSCLTVKRETCWPKPFVCPDRQAVRAPFAIMVANGWQRQNLLGDHYFEPGTGELTVAGQEKIRWIVESAPQPHRTIYVHRGADAKDSAARVEAAQQYVARIVGEGELPAVVPTSIPEPGWPADRVEFITRKFQSTAPTPRLPKADAGNNAAP